MAYHPYKNLPDNAFWRSSVAKREFNAVDPVGNAKFTLNRRDKVATAGSCFAQHIARHLSKSGFNYLVTEKESPIIPQHIAEKYNYGLFTARYANIYTSRQMLQLLQRAYGLFEPKEDIWSGDSGNFIDPFRPQIQPNGFATSAEFYADREQHFAAVREAVETLDCLVFTLGLTECWLSRVDGAAYPLCPGTAGGEYDESQHEFHNLNVSEIIGDLEEIYRFISERNKASKYIITVSPVPLIATASGENVLTATTYSKSVLRAAAGEFSSKYDNVAYFPSYEIITGSFNRGEYFLPDLRSVTEEGVSHVMRLFLKHYAQVDAGDVEATPQQQASKIPTMQELISVVCEEETLQQFENE